MTCVEIALTIPDNEAETAEATLRRLGLPIGRLERSDLYRFELESGGEDALLEALARIETIYNPNKHRLHLRESATPQAGEAWVHEVDAATAGASRACAVGSVRIAGRELRGVRRIERFVAWRLSDEGGLPATAAVVTQALDALLCNTAFQRSMTR